MANITFNVEELICEEAILTNAVSGIPGQEHKYTLSWTSESSYYNTVAPPATMELWFSVEGGPFQAYSGNPVPFDATNFIFDAVAENAYTDVGIEFMLILNSSACSSHSQKVFAPFNY